MQVKIAKVLAQREQAQRKRNLTRYIPDAAAAIWAVLDKMAGSNARGPKRRRLQQEQQQQQGGGVAAAGQQQQQQPGQQQELLAMVVRKEVG